MHNLSIEQTPIHALRARDRNARTHSKRQIRQIANSIERFGFTNPILTDDNLLVLAGHGRLETAKLLGMATVPSIRLSHMSAAEKRAYAIADNAIALKAGWDRETLAIELQELVDVGFEIELTGFETAEVDLMLNDWKLASDNSHAEDACPSPTPSEVSKVGDLWQLGPHRLICGDARDAETYHRLLDSDRADLVFKDNAGMGSFYRSRHELVFVFKKGEAAHTNTFELGQHGRYRTNVWEYAGVNTFRTGRLDELAMHPTVKPVAMLADAIRDFTKRGAIVLDPFAGSGSTLIAADKTGRHARCMEYEPRYCDVIVRRWQAYSGKAALFEGTDLTFEDFEGARASSGRAAAVAPPLDEALP
jgi:hypothetical protein